MSSNIVFQIVKTYPVTTWAAVGVLAYVWKAGLAESMYERAYAD